ncbi:hypothetical protein ACFSJ3_15740 [Corallincola platygyrae]|uniref:Uncharacterized protein n=1 Tax=Corallincola platygyrae TaxID=1193278 RepID=A0ABW4XSH0_9GAMM
MKENIHNRISLGVAVMAVVLSQFPPIHKLFDDAELKIEVAQNLYATEQLGHVVLQPTVTIHNQGEVSGIIDRITLDLTRHSDEESMNFTVHSFYPPEAPLDPLAPPVALPFHSIHVKPNDSWTAMTIASKRLPNQEDMNLISELANKMKLEIGAFNPDQPDFHEVSQELFEEVSEISWKNLEFFTPGEYSVTLTARDSDGNSVHKSNYTFLIDDWHMDQFGRSIEKYRYGESIVRPPAESYAIVISLKTKE